MNIEINKDGTVLRDGEKVGSVLVNEESLTQQFIPIEGLHHKTVTAVEKFLKNGLNDLEGKEVEILAAGVNELYAPALDRLGILLDQLDTNAPIYRKEGNVEQAEGNERVAISIRALMGLAGVQDPDSWKPVVEASNEPPKEPKPAYNEIMGDLAPEYIEWYRRNHTAKEFDDKYKARLSNIRENAPEPFAFDDEQEEAA